MSNILPIRDSFNTAPLRPEDFQPPETLSDEARACWHDIIPQLLSRADLCKADLFGVEMICEHHALWRRCVDAAHEADDRGFASKAECESRQQSDCLRKLLNEYGLTLRSKSQLSPGATKKKKPSVHDQLMERKKAIQSGLSGGMK